MPNLGALAADIAEVQGRIKEAFYANLFPMLAESDRREITAREIDERREEKMLMLRPRQGTHAHYCYFICA